MKCFSTYTCSRDDDNDVDDLAVKEDEGASVRVSCSSVEEVDVDCVGVLSDVESGKEGREERVGMEEEEEEGELEEEIDCGVVSNDGSEGEHKEVAGADDAGGADDNNGRWISASSSCCFAFDDSIDSKQLRQVDARASNEYPGKLACLVWLMYASPLYRSSDDSRRRLCIVSHRFHSNAARLDPRLITPYPYLSIIYIYSRPPILLFYLGTT